MEEIPKRGGGLNRLALVFDEVERLHLRSVLMRTAGKAALADQLPRSLGAGVILKPTDEATVEDMQCMAREVAEMVRTSDLPVQTKAYWLSMWLEVVTMTSRLIDLLPHVLSSPEVIDTIPAGILGTGFNTHPEHFDTASLAAVIREFYYAMEKGMRPQLMRDFPGINDGNGWGRGLRTEGAGKARRSIIEPYMGTPALAGARSA